MIRCTPKSLKKSSVTLEVRSPLNDAHELKSQSAFRLYRFWTLPLHSTARADQIFHQRLGPIRPLALPAEQELQHSLCERWILRLGIEGSREIGDS